MSSDLLRKIPSVDELLRGGEISALAALLPTAVASGIVRKAVDELRAELLSGGGGEESLNALAGTIEARFRSLLSPSLVRVVNASGTVLHTNLGRALLPQAALEALNLAATGPLNLEFDLGHGSRGERDSRAEELIVALTSAEAACVVNNNAAAVLIALNTLAEDKEVVISRGELVEIGGSFRLPEIIEKSGCVLKEVGTTNRTHPRDYSEAITEVTAILFKAHTSNYKVTGFTAEVPLKELVAIGHDSGLPVVEDLGSGSLVDLSVYGLKKEPVVGERIAAGVDVVTFSADKLLGGPQAGIIAGKKEFVDRIRRNPLKRALRVDKLTLSALEATLRLYLNPKGLAKALPTIRHLSRPLDELEVTATAAADLLKGRLGSGYSVLPRRGESIVGSGSLPGHTIPTWVLEITHGSTSPEKIFRLFLDGATPVLGRVSKDKFILDIRTIDRIEDLLPF
ncbi:L-seryl-tRNA(Sec) selenium transferase [hydrothermal vent metagenome]|uniref:L-seryl-tRNA(Sec) selenium transferase n=1 Tax=hydrothermal vent metagenome TaxID=652676 RepID=A0A3B0QRH1_9ZZZZ